MKGFPSAESWNEYAHALSGNSAGVLREKTQVRAPDCQLLNRDEWLADARAVIKHYSFQNAAWMREVRSMKGTDLHLAIACLPQILQHRCFRERPQSAPQQHGHAQRGCRQYQYQGHSA